MTSVELVLLGRFQARAAGHVIDVPGRKERALLAILAMPPGEPCSRDKLAGLLWSERGNKQAHDSLKQAVFRLRKSFGSLHPLPVLADRDSLTLDRAQVAVDVKEFEQHIGEGTPDAVARATTLYHGDLLDGLDVRDPAFEEWLLLEQQRLRNMAREALARVLDRHLASGACDQAGAAARRLLALDPLWETAHRALMQIYAGQDQTALALKQYQLCRDALQSELGIRPEAATERLYQSIRARRTTAQHMLAQAPAAVSAETSSLLDAPPQVQHLEASDFPAKPTVAVLPFDNLSGDPEQQYFSDGISDDIATDLSKVSGLLVIARNSAFTYRDRTITVQEVSRELGVRYVLQGSVRKAGNRVRIVVRLIDGTTGVELWADRYDRDLTDIFAVQDEVTREIVSALAVKLTQGEQRRIQRKDTENLEAYDHYLRGRQLVLQRSKEANEEARPLLERAIELDRQFARAYSMLACVHILDYVNHWGDPPEESLRRAHELAQGAVALDDDDPEAHWALGQTYLDLRQHDRAMAEARKALARDPNFAWAHGLLGQVLHYAGRSQDAILPLTTAMRLDPNNHQDPHLHYLAQAYFGMGRYEEAAASLKRRIVCKPDTDMSRVLLASCYGHLGRAEEAKALWQEALLISPNYSLEHRRRVLPYKDPADFQRVVAGLRKAGLTE